MSNQRTHFLLVCQALDDAWVNPFQYALERYGPVTPCDKGTALQQLQQRPYEIALLDENILTGDYTFIQRVTQLQPSVQVIVVSDSGNDWKKARLAFQYGSIDYWMTNINQQALEKSIQEITGS
jgi:DNA-binding NtrC family response regulator